MIFLLVSSFFSFIDGDGCDLATLDNFKNHWKNTPREKESFDFSLSYEILTSLTKKKRGGEAFWGHKQF